MIEQSADTERVLGQIERGEVRAGRDAAREIAAKAQAAYGSAWTTTLPRPAKPAILRPTRRPQANHGAVAYRARREPGTWVVVGEYGSSPSAAATAWLIRTAGNGKRGLGRYYAPAGAFETDTRRTEFGAEALVRYVGQPAASAEDMAWDDALAALSGGAA